jgi:hypothetical protein
MIHIGGPMRKMKTLVGATAAAILLGLFATPGAAWASTQADVNACMRLTVVNGDIHVAYPFNDCGGRVINAKVVIDFGPDKGCSYTYFGSGYTIKSSNWIGRNPHLVACAG